MHSAVKTLAACAILGASVAWYLSAPSALPLEVAAGHQPDAGNGALVFAASGCSSCHAAPDAADKNVLAGGYALVIDFGTFYAPNISWGPQGIADWSLPEFAHALRQGVSPTGKHYYPAFPYTSYVRMTDSDVADLFAYMQTLPADPTPNRPHDAGFPFNLSRGIGLWKRLYLTDAPVLEGDLSAEVIRGRYLVEGLGHCAECHTSRDALGGLDKDRWLEGAPNPSGKGRIPDISPTALDWSEGDLAAYFKSGFTPEYDSVGGSMAAVVENLALLPDSDRRAIALYLKALPAP